MAGNRLETFTDRSEAIALFELLRRRSAQQASWPLLPLLAYLGAGGSGKSTLIEYLIQLRCHDGNGHVFLPYAYVDFNKEATLRDLLPILVELREQLSNHTDEQGKRLTFPRFDLGAAIAMTVLSGRALPSPHQDELRELLQQAKGVFQALKEMGNAFGNVLGAIPPILVALDWAVRLARKVPNLQDVLQQLEYVSDWKWYCSQEAGITVSADASIKEVILRLQALSESSRPEKEGSAYLINRVLPAAFLADLRENLDGSYTPRTWTYSTNIVIFLDGFEALQESSKETAKLLLDTLVCNEYRLQGKTDPLLVVLGSRHRLHKLIHGEEYSSPDEQTRLQDNIEVQEEAQGMYLDWQQRLQQLSDPRYLRLSNLYLPYSLRDFGLDHTRHYLVQRDRQAGTNIFADEAFVNAIHRATHGHPLYLDLVVAAAMEAHAWKRQLSVSDLEEAEVSRATQSEQARQHIDEQIADFLLSLFLRQLPPDEQQALLFCALPRALDRILLRILLSLTDMQAQERLKRYRPFTFISVRQSDNKLVLHPVVRNLLLRKFRQSSDPHDPQSDYQRLHTLLRTHFHQLATATATADNEQAEIEEAYHALALGDPGPAIDTGVYAQRVNLALWRPLIDAVSEAPIELGPTNIEQPAEYKRPHYHLEDSVRAIIHYSWFLPTLDETSEKAALLWRNMGRVYCDLQGGDQQANLQQAIACYQRALEVYTRVRFPAEWVTTMLDLGEVYSLLRGKNRQTTKQIALTCYQEALEVCSEQTLPLEWARAQNNLGEALSDVPGTDQQANLRQAIICYRAALRVRTKEVYPFDWAITQNNLGNALARLIEGNRKTILQDAIACYWQALSVHVQESYPVEWARAQNNLGNAYRNLAQEDQTKQQEHLQQAIACYEAAFQVRTQQDYPADWATTQHNLGLAYSLLSGKDQNKQQEDFEKAVACYKAALEVYTQEAYPIDWARTQNALGNLYRYKPEKDENPDKKRENLQLAVDYFKAALQIYTREGFPEAWARTQYNLGLTYAHMQAQKEEDRQKNLEQAITSYQEALKVFTREIYSEDWAKTQSALGNAYRLLPLGNQQENLQMAIDHYKLAEDGYRILQSSDDLQKMRTYLGIAGSKLAKLRRQRQF